MANLTVTIPEDLREEIKEHKEVNWSEIARRAMSEHLRKLRIANAIANKSQLTKSDVAELSKLVKQGISKKHGL
mgnify:CR=1 FL=1